jgi:multiple sugar transport system ATP-binding protein
MVDVKLENVCKNFGDVKAVDNVSLTVKHGEFLVLLGPSGCGKTTALRCIAGLERVDKGRIFIGNEDVTDFPPAKRGVSMVFQSYAVFPHMSVFNNIAFGLKLRKAPVDHIKKSVKRAAELLQIGNLLDRFPHQLSGGQRQRVAVARAIVVEPKVLLMDEPLSNVDALLRLQMRAELKLLQRELGATTIYVTHDQVEAMSIGDRIAVMENGKIIQCDTPMKIYDEPINVFVGGFIGTPPMNFLEGTVCKVNDKIGVKIEDFFLESPEVFAEELEKREGEEIIVGIRPENVEARNKPFKGAMEVKNLITETLGSNKLLTVQIGEKIAKFVVPPDFQVGPSGKVWLNIHKEKLRFMDKSMGKSIISD